ncbi:CAP domain-containing protein [Micromonospora sp. URMC 105]|uniref:CAP domain-containing protein n=1 Tax=Micromonospora sp. URMC 105 TaxID=3423413 RepID=UPI003F1B7E4E
MEATGVYGWTDPIDPDGASRRPQPPTDEPPAWLTDRPEPRSAYLFGDQPELPGDAPADAPTAQWRSSRDERPYAGPDPAPTAPPAGRPDPTAHPFAPPADWRHTTGGLRAVDADPPADWRHSTGGLRAVETDAPAEGHGRHRQRGRFPRPLVLGGAAAAATLVVSLGVGALALAGGDDSGATDPASVDDTIAAAPLVPDAGAPADALAGTAGASPTASPTAARPTPSPSRTVKPTPAPKRTTAASRQSANRTGSASTGAPNSVSPGVSSQAREVVDLVNAERAKAGCGKLSIDDKLMTAAQRHSQDQADHRNMSHTGSDGSDAGDRIERVGYSWRTYGENVAWNQKTPAEVMRAWMNSQGHRENILNCAFTEIGVGVASSNGPYWTQVFAAPR